MSVGAPAGVEAGRLPAEVTGFVGRRDELVKVKRLLAGSRLVTLTGVGGSGKTQLAAPATALTPREREVAELVGQRLSNKQIATRLVVSQRTAESHVENILRKLGFATRTQVATWATLASSPGLDAADS